MDSLQPQESSVSPYNIPWEPWCCSYTYSWAWREIIWKIKIRHSSDKQSSQSVSRYKLKTKWLWSYRVQVWASSLFPGAPRKVWELQKDGILVTTRSFIWKCPQMERTPSRVGGGWDCTVSHLLKGHLTVSGDFFDWSKRWAGMESSRRRKCLRTSTKHSHQRPHSNTEDTQPKC